MQTVSRVCIQVRPGSCSCSCSGFSSSPGSGASPGTRHARAASKRSRHARLMHAFVHQHVRALDARLGHRHSAASAFVHAPHSVFAAVTITVKPRLVVRPHDVVVKFNPRVGRRSVGAVLDERKVVAHFRGADVDDDAHEAVRKVRPRPAHVAVGQWRATGSGQAFLGVRVHVQVVPKRAAGVELLLLHRVVVEFEPLEVHQQRGRQVRDAHPLHGVHLCGTRGALVCVVAGEVFAGGVGSQGVLQGWAP